MTHINRRYLMALGLAGVFTPLPGLASTPREISWDDLIPPGVPYADIIGEGEINEATDTWRPIFDENATKLNILLNGENIRLPGFIVPLEQGSEGVTEFVLVPYAGACIHTPPPPPNQLILVRAIDPWPTDNIWDPVWVEGKISTQLMTTEVAETGYAMTADKIEAYDW
ncbi:MAG: DUF3299 domain-containing protein [Paracoccaceae bacterium]|nr:DUF3299 domain-containing protein [Paracoccaceae bacterium]